jgi:hypothetical protein
MTEDRWIRASEIQAYGYCARAWWLRYVLGLEPADRGNLEAGTERHLRHGRRVLRAEGLNRVAIALLIIALVVAALAVVRFLGGG